FEGQIERKWRNSLYFTLLPGKTESRDEFARDCLLRQRVFLTIEPWGGWRKRPRFRGGLGASGDRRREEPRRSSTERPARVPRREENRAQGLVTATRTSAR